MYLTELKVPKDPNSKIMREGSLANALNYWPMPWDNYDVSSTHLKLCRPAYSQGVVANSKPYLEQLPCFMERNDHSQGWKGVTQGPRALEAEPSSECRPWLLVLHSLCRLCIPPQPMALKSHPQKLPTSLTCHFPSASYCCAKLSGLFLTLGYRRSHITQLNQNIHLSIHLSK